jgi:uncharacterized membrane protein YhaH (DUF805 family)
MRGVFRPKLLGTHMNNIIQNYRGFDGRLNRQPFWIGAIILAVVGFIVQWILVAIIGGNGVLDVQGLIASGKTTQDIAPMLVDLARKSAIAQLITFVILAYPAAAISIKRRHDRGNAGWDIWVYLALAFIVSLVQVLGLGMTTTEIQGMIIPTPTPLFTVLGIIAGILAIYLLVVCGFLRGTAGPNNYGPDPLQA